MVWRSKDLVARIGLEDAKELWDLSKEGTEYVRAQATEQLMPGIAVTEGALEVSNIDVGDRLISELQMLGEDFGTEVEGWQIDQVRAQLKTDRYFHGIDFPKAFQVDGRKYLEGLAALAKRAGARIFEDTPVVGIDASGIRKRIVTPSARFAPRTSFWPATFISARPRGVCRRRCCRSGAMPGSPNRSAIA